MSNLAGAMLSDYFLLECISRGTLADVYRARQNDGPYEVAVKVFRPAYAEREDFRASFLREAEKIGQFDHPHILPLIEYGEGDGLLYAVTPLVLSGTLEDLLKKVGGKFPALQARPIVQQLCAAVQYVHEHEVIHGNLKLRNVFVANDGRMLLADFGIARGSIDGQQALQKTDWGAVQYAAPEQSLGLLRRASDIYALGALFFRLLTGAPVFVGQTPMEVVLKHVRDAPPLARSLEPGISDVVDTVLQKALSKRAEERYTTAAELGRAFSMAVSFAPVASPVARSVNLAMQVAGFAPDTPPPASIVALASQPTAPIPIPLLSLEQRQVFPLPPADQSAIFPLPPADQSAIFPLPPDLMQQSGPQPSVLPEQHGLTILPPSQPQQMSPVPGVSSAGGPGTRLLSEPVEWSPLASEPLEMGGIPAGAGEYLRGQPPSAPLQALEQEQEAAPEWSGKKRIWLPLLVLLLLILGLLAALLSSFLLPPPSSHGAGLRAWPGITAGQVSLMRRELGV